MIKVQLKGRLGNQLFQYAFAKIAARKLNTSFLLDTNNVPNDMFWFQLDYPFSGFGNSLYFKIYNFLQKKIRFSNAKEYLDCTVPEMVEYEDNCLYKGYFQYSNLMEANRDMLLETFRIKEKARQEFNKKFKTDFDTNKTLVISIRLGDYRTTFLSEYENAPVLLEFEWYYKILKTINLPDYQIFIISDEIEFAEKNFHFPGLRATFVKESPSVQFQLLMHADVAILSNSTFAWWGGFLNVKPGRRIIAPKYFMGHKPGIEFPNGIETRLFEWQ